MFDLEVWPKVSNQEKKIVQKILDSNNLNYWTGNECKHFEKEFSNFMGLKYSLCVSNGSVGLDIAIKALELPIGSEVIVTPRSYIASVTCVLNNNLKPVFADVDFNSQNISINTIKKIFSKKVKAIVLVHLAGMPCDMGPILKFAKKNKIRIIEDCSQSHGAKYKNKHTGTFGDISVWSFCNDKILNTLGEGGMVGTNSLKIYKKIYSIRDCGKNYSKITQKKPLPTKFNWIHDYVGGSNYRMTEVQAGIGRYQLKQLNYWVKLRNRNSNLLRNSLKSYKSIYMPPIEKDFYHSYYRLYVYLNKKFLNKSFSRKKIIELLNKNKIYCNTGSCPEIYREVIFKKKNFIKKRLPVARKLSLITIAFLVHPTITFKNFKDKCKKIKEIIKQATIKIDT